MGERLRIWPCRERQLWASVGSLLSASEGVVRLVRTAPVPDIGVAVDYVYRSVATGDCYSAATVLVTPPAAIAQAMIGKGRVVGVFLEHLKGIVEKLLGVGVKTVVQIPVGFLATVFIASARTQENHPPDARQSPRREAL